jgi:chromosome segregation ATPase
LNPNYENLTSIKNIVESRIKVLDTEIDLNEEEIRSKEIEIKEMQKNLTDLLEEEKILSNTLENNRKRYLNSEEEYNNAEQILAAKNYQLYLSSSPKIMENVISPNIKLNIAIAAVLAFMLAVFIVFFKEFMKEE